MMVFKLLGCLYMLLTPSAGQIMEVIKSWSNIAADNSPMKVACKGSAEIKFCRWKLGNWELTSHQAYRKHDIEYVELGTGKSKDMCFLNIALASRGKHQGKWTCELEGECPESEYLKADFGPHGLGLTATDKYRKKREIQRLCSGGVCECWNRDNATVEIDVVRQDYFDILPAQSIYYVEVEGPVSATVRSSIHFDKCIIRKDGQKIVDIQSTDSRERCVSMPGSRSARVCINLATGIPSCLLIIRSARQEMAGEWQFTIKTEKEEKTTSIELRTIEIPIDITMEIRNTEYSQRDGTRAISLSEGTETISCIADVNDISAPTQPQVVLFLGTRMVPGGTRCKSSPRRNAICREFELNIEDKHEGMDLTCAARLPPTDKGNCEKLVYNGLEMAKDILVNFPPKLVRPEGSVDRTVETCNRKLCATEDIKICDSSICLGSDYTFKIILDSKPEPTEIYWILRDNKGRYSETVREDNDVMGYKAEKLKKMSGKDTPYRYQAVLHFKGIRRQDRDPDSVHLLEVKNEAGKTRFMFRFDNSRGCGCDEPIEDYSEDADYYYEEEDAEYNQALERKENEDIKPFLDSCLALGGSILESYNTDGSRRNDRQTERNFQDNLKNFFEKASCSGYGESLMDFYETNKVESPRNPTRNEGQILFTRTGVNKVKSVQSTLVKDRNILAAAQQAVNIGNEEPAAPREGYDDLQVDLLQEDPDQGDVVTFDPNSEREILTVSSSDSELEIDEDRQADESTTEYEFSDEAATENPSIDFS